jgi:hypothetical protein
VRQVVAVHGRLLQRAAALLEAGHLRRQQQHRHATSASVASGAGEGRSVGWRNSSAVTGLGRWDSNREDFGTVFQPNGTNPHG